MKSVYKLLTGLIAVLAITATVPCSAVVQSPKIALVNFKTCVEKSKIGKQEQTNFENMKKQMEDVLAEKEKSLKELSGKFSDEDYLDSLSSEAEAELKHKFRSLNQELGQHQQQFYQVLQQANFKIVQKINDEINEASKSVAKTKSLDLIINEEGAFYFNPVLDISEDVVKVMDDKFNREQKK